MRHEKLSVGELTVDTIIGRGAPEEMGIGDKWYIDGTNGSDGNSGKSANDALKSIDAG